MKPNLKLILSKKKEEIENSLQQRFYLILSIFLISYCNNYTESKKKIQATLGLLSQKSSHTIIQNKTVNIDLKTGISTNLRKNLVFKIIQKNEKKISLSSNVDSWKNLTNHPSIVIPKGAYLQFGIINQDIASKNIFNLKQNGIFKTEKSLHYFSLNDLSISNNSKKQTNFISLILTIQSLNNFENLDKVISQKDKIVKLIEISQLYRDFENSFKELIPSISHKIVNFTVVQEEIQNQKFAEISAKNKSNNPHQNLIPSKPKSLQLINSDTNSLEISWKPSIDLDGKIEHYEASIQNEIWKNLGLVNSYQFSNLSPSSQYTIKVKSMDNSKEYSQISTIIKKTKNKKPTTPQNLNILRNDKNIIISWKASQDEGGKIIDYEVSSDSSNWISTDNLLTYTFNNLLFGNLYKFQVKAKDNENTYSSIASRSYILENQIPTSPPNFQTKNISETSVLLSWEASTDSDGTIQNYEIRKNDSNWIVLGLEKSYTFKNLTPSSNYIFQVRAKDNENTHSENSSITHKTNNVPPATPSNLTAIISYSYIKLQWNESLDYGNGYIVDYEVKIANDWISTKNQNLHTFKNLKNGKNYTLKVRAKDDENAYSLESSITIKTLSSYIKHFNTNANVNSIDFSPNRNQFLIGTNSNIQIWNITNSTRIITINGHDGPVNSVKFSKNGNQFLSAGTDGKIKVWSYNGNLIKTLSEHTRKVNMIDINQNGKIISASDDTTVKIWNLNGSSTISIKTIDPIGSPKFKSATFSSNGQFFVTGDTNKKIRIWNIRTGIQQKPTLNTNHKSSIYSVILSKNNQKIISGSYDKTIKIWDNTTQTITLITTLKGHTGAIQELASSPSGEEFISVSSDKLVKIWKLNTGDLIKTFTKHSAGVYSVTYSQDGLKILTGGSDKKVRLWNMD